MAARYIEQQRAQTGNTPAYWQVYDFLLGQATTRIQLEQTAPTYWYCVDPFAPPYSNFFLSVSRTNPGSCPEGYQGPFTFNSASNTSNARMVFWDAGPSGPPCP